jgi:hypothetical protein
MTEGTDEGLAQDATAMAILIALGGSPSSGGTGQGWAQDATLHAILLAISGGGGSTPYIPTVWTAVAAGGVGIASATVASAFECATTGAQCAIEFPANPTDGLVIYVKAVGASNTNGILLTPNTGQSLENPSNQGVILAVNTPTTFFDQGGCLNYKYQAAGSRWLISARA